MFITISISAIAVRRSLLRHAGRAGLLHGVVISVILSYISADTVIIHCVYFIGLISLKFLPKTNNILHKPIHDIFYSRLGLVLRRSVSYVHSHFQDIAY